MNKIVQRQLRTETATWTAASLAELKSQWESHYTLAELAELRQAVETAKKNGLTVGTMTKDSFLLPTLGKRMAALGQLLEDGLGIALMRGIPVNDYQKNELELLFAGLGVHLGVLLPQSKAGEKIGVVADSGNKLASGARGTKTSDQLPFHTDRSDLIGLLCVREATKGGESYVVSATQVYNIILRDRPDLLEVLCQPFWHRRTAWEAGGPDTAYPLPIFGEREGKFAVRYLRHFIRVAQELPSVPRLTDQQIEALDMVDRLCMSEECLVRMPFEPGDIQWLNNFVAFHGRAAYEDENADKEDKGRFLYRLWLASPLSRPLPDGFEAIYGRTEPGVIRGGALPAETIQII
ncbi:TauD/TfdA family dioxygenase [Ochrobactrum sp. MR28]|nr:TauD/TfdA family dioxygenase [Ochrobactrum sp. MR28]MBX8817736.1 TauD/TfdA family dioxygenase [Ochrobactrum sp. MR31]